LAGADVGIDETIDFQGGQDVAIADKERFVPDPGFNVLEPPSGFEKDRFVEEGEWCSSIGSVGECFLPLSGQVVGVDGELLDSGGQAVVEGVLDQGSVKDGDERFGKDVGEWPQTRAQTGSKEKGFLDRRAHERKGWRVRERVASFCEARMPSPGVRGLEQVVEGPPKGGGHGQVPEGLGAVEFLGGATGGGRKLGEGAAVDVHGHLVVGDVIPPRGKEREIRQLIVTPFGQLPQALAAGALFPGEEDGTAALAHEENVFVNFLGATPGLLEGKSGGGAGGTEIVDRTLQATRRPGGAV
jgi:hypothetical protein|tara:strand:- start:17302 stop:18198 length:897 start_codon:yes stop_codon:yes gene_type:complete